MLAKENAQVGTVVGCVAGRRLGGRSIMLVGRGAVSRPRLAPMGEAFVVDYVTATPQDVRLASCVDVGVLSLPHPSAVSHSSPPAGADGQGVVFFAAPDWTIGVSEDPC